MSQMTSSRVLRHETTQCVRVHTLAFRQGSFLWAVVVAFGIGCGGGGGGDADMIDVGVPDVAVRDGKPLEMSIPDIALSDAAVADAAYQDGGPNDSTVDGCGYVCGMLKCGQKQVCVAPSVPALGNFSATCVDTCRTTSDCAPGLHCVEAGGSVDPSGPYCIGDAIPLRCTKGPVCDTFVVPHCVGKIAALPYRAFTGTICGQEFIQCGDGGCVDGGGCVK